MSGNEPKNPADAVEGVGAKIEDGKRRVFTHRNAGAGCRARSRRPLDCDQRHSGSGKRIPDGNRRRRDGHYCVRREISCARGSSSSVVATPLSVASSMRTLCACAEPPAVKPQWPLTSVNTFPRQDENEIKTGGFTCTRRATKNLHDKEKHSYHVVLGGIV